MTRTSCAGVFCALLALLSQGCGSGGTTTEPVPYRPEVPQNEPYYVSARITVMEPFIAMNPGDGPSTRLPLDCNGTAIPPGTVFDVEATTAGGGLAFGAVPPGDPREFGDPTNVLPAVGGTDENLNVSVILNPLQPISPVSSLPATPPPGGLLQENPLLTNPKKWTAVVNLDPFCQDQRGMLFLTEVRSCVPGSDCYFSDSDALYLDEYTLETDANGDVVFQAGTPIAGHAHFVAQTNFNDTQTGGTAYARVDVDVCFRFPALSPEVTMPTSPAPCP